VTASLINLYNERTVNQISNFCDFADSLDALKLKRLYMQLFKDAPKRGDRGKKYFVDEHDGVTSSGSFSNRGEEHLAVALFNATKNGKEFFLNDSQKLSFLDYQFPLKARQDDKGIGKVDLFCSVGNTTPAVAELKVSGKSNLGDTPLRALLEGLAYCALVEANADAIAKEAKVKFGINLKVGKPDLLIMAPFNYWSGYLNKKAAGPWTVSIKTLADKIYDHIKVRVHFLSLINAQFEMGLNNEPAKLTGDCRITHVNALI
jgi:hypothetical protein